MGDDGVTLGCGGAVAMERCRGRLADTVARGAHHGQSQTVTSMGGWR